MKKAIRNVVFQNIRFLGNRISVKLIRFGHFINSSIWYKKNVAPIFENRNIMYQYLINNQNLIENEICYLEFGVSKGGGFHIWYQQNKNPKSRFFGFDTFEGLPEDWGSVKKGAYTAHGQIPETNDKRCDFIVGLFQDTLIDFLKENNISQQLVIHLDADLYNATLYVLIHLARYLKPNDIIIFDEFFYVSKADHEMRAFIDFLSLYDIKFKPIAKTLSQFTIKIINE